MAVSTSANESGLDDLILCPVCFETYDEVNKIPKFLSCHHTFCLKCLQEVAGNSRRITCPLCRQLEYKGIDKLPTNSGFIRIIKHLQREALLKWCYSCRRKPARGCHQQSHFIVEVADLSQAAEPFAQLLETTHQLRKQVISVRNEIAGRLTQARDFFSAIAAKIEESIQCNELRIKNLSQPLPHQVKVPFGNSEDPLLKYQQGWEDCIREQEEVKKIMEELKALEIDWTSTPLPSSVQRMDSFKREFGAIFSSLRKENGGIIWPSRILDPLLTSYSQTPSKGSMVLSDSQVTSSTSSQPPRKRKRLSSVDPVMAPPFARILYGDTSFLRGTLTLEGMFANPSHSTLPRPTYHMLKVNCREIETSHISDWSWNPRKDVLACALEAGIISLIHFQSQSGSSYEIENISLDPSPMCSLDWNESGRKLAVGTETGAIFLWEKNSGPVTLEKHSCRITVVRWNHLGSSHLLLSYSIDGNIILWDTITSSELQTLHFTPGNIFHVQWTSRCNLTYVLREGKILFWRCGDEKAVKVIRFSLRKDYVHISVQKREHSCSNGVLRIISSVVESGCRTRKLRNEFGNLDVCLSDTKTSISDEFIARIHLHSIQIWNIGYGNLVQTLMAPPDVSCLSFSPDGSKLAAASASNISIWSTANWEEVLSASMDTQICSHLVWNQSSNKLAVTCLGDSTRNNVQPSVHVIDLRQS